MSAMPTESSGWPAPLAQRHRGPAAPPRVRRGRGEAGQVGGLYALVFGVLIFVLGTLVIVNAWGVLDSKFAASAAATGAARAFVQVPAQNPGGAARAAADQAIIGSGRSLSRMTLALSGNATRCGEVVAEVKYRVPVLSVPLLGGWGNGFTVSATQSELLDPYRSGLAGEATCAG
ncbi:MAG: hypothetical protein ACRDWV_08065 [Acidimicrobiales bacterium]